MLTPRVSMRLLDAASAVVDDFRQSLAHGRVGEVVALRADFSGDVLRQSLDARERPLLVGLQVGELLAEIGDGHIVVGLGAVVRLARRDLAEFPRAALRLALQIVGARRQRLVADRVGELPLARGIALALDLLPRERQVVHVRAEDVFQRRVGVHHRAEQFILNRVVDARLVRDG
jgi:hypothetical protein